MKTIRTHFLDFSDQLSPACGLLLSVLENKIFKERTLGGGCLFNWLIGFSRFSAGEQTHSLCAGQVLCFWHSQSQTYILAYGIFMVLLF